jgi:hypothetical protein
VRSSSAREFAGESHKQAASAQAAKRRRKTGWRKAPMRETANMLVFMFQRRAPMLPAQRTLLLTPGAARLLIPAVQNTKPDERNQL